MYMSGLSPSPPSVEGRAEPLCRMGCPVSVCLLVCPSRARTLAFLNLNLGMRVYRPPSPNLHV